MAMKKFKLLDKRHDLAIIMIGLAITTAFLHTPFMVYLGVIVMLLGIIGLVQANKK